MKTFETTVTRPLLEITHDDMCESPRTSMPNVGRMTVLSNRSYSPDPQFVDVVKSTGNRAKNSENHIELVRKELMEAGEDVLFIFPINKYEHGGVKYSLGSNFGFDYSNNGFYIVTRELAEGMVTDLSEENIRSIVESEIETYNSWVNGEVYMFTLYDSDGDVEDSCSGFYAVEDIMEHLSEEWKDEDLNDYVK